MESIIEGYREFQSIIRGYTPKVVKYLTVLVKEHNEV